MTAPEVSPRETGIKRKEEESGGTAATGSSTGTDGVKRRKSALTIIPGSEEGSTGKNTGEKK